ncbi:hypothetical protein DCO45_18620 [Comamonas sp. JNW]|nr:hypothetical protein DCO45_18620 [Comamonas sp. JNW]
MAGGFAFAVFCGDETVKFNLNMKREGQETEARLARHLGVLEEQIFPITYTIYDGWTAKYDRYW